MKAFEMLIMQIVRDGASLGIHINSAGRQNA